MKKIFLSVVIMALLCVNAQAVPQSFAPVVQKAAPSVVNISTTKTVTRQIDPFFDDFFGGMFGAPSGRGGGQKYKSTALGSGFIIDLNGYIITNNHVIDGADEIIVKLQDEREFKAEVVGSDPLTDLALLKIDTKGARITPILLGDSELAEIGDWVVAIGNPLGLGGTVTAGILSAKGRVLGDGPYDNFIQTDVSINPGNSGGPLINMNGEVIGINTAIIQSAQGLGFAVPVNMLKNILPKLKEGKVTRGWIGVSLQPLDENLAKSFGLTDTQGVLIADVSRGEPGDKAGLKAGDIIIAVDGQKAHNSRSLVGIIGGKSPNDKVKLTIIRDGKELNITVTLGERPVEGQSVSSYNNNKGKERKAGDITVTDIDQKDAQELGISGGVVITNIDQKSNAYNMGLRPGDIIVWINRKSVTNANDFYEKYEKVKKGDLVALKIISRNSSRFLAFNK